MKNIINEKEFFINNFAYRKNILNWISFEKNKNILILGSQYGILSECFDDCQIFCIDEDEYKNKINKNKHKNVNVFDYNINQFINNFDQKIDYIIVDGYLDKTYEKQAIVEKCMSLLDSNGQMIILANNKLALRYFAGVKEGLNSEFGHLKDNSLYSKKEWEALFDQLQLQYQFFYPYPNYIFPEYIFKKAPRLGEVNTFTSSFDDIRISYFNEITAFNQIIKSGYFEEFSNSFLIVLNKKIEEISYVKFASERKKEYQIYTIINESKNGKEVVKTPIYSEGKKHMEKIYEFYLNYKMINQNKKIQYCPVELKNNQLYFEFVEGISLESLVYQDVQNNDVLKIKNKLDIINEIINIEPVKKFQISEKFLSIFGYNDYGLLADLEAYENNNIDLIFDNVIVNDKYNVIDFEWIFNCLIPKSFIIFRTIFHSHALSYLKKDIIEELYDSYGISKELRNLYLKMETNFQAYVSDYKLSDIYNDFNCHTIKVIKQKDRIIKNEIIQNNIVYDYSLADEKQLDISFYINKQNAILKVEKKAIIRIDKLAIDNQDAIFTTNADIIIGNNYYFSKPPEINIQNNSGKELEIKAFYYYYADDCINDIISLLLDNKMLNQRLARLRKHPYVKLLDKIGG